METKETKKVTEQAPKITEFSIFGKVIRKGVCSVMDTSIYSKKFGDYVKRYDGTDPGLTEGRIIDLINEAEEYHLSAVTRNPDFDTGKDKIRDAKKNKLVVAFVIDTREYRVAVFVQEKDITLSSLSAMQRPRK